MSGFARAGVIALTLIGVAAVQEKKPIEIYAENNEHGVSIRAPKSPGKDQMWMAFKTESGFFKDSAVLVKHRVDLFSVEVNVTRKDSSQPMSTWSKTAEIAKNSREHFTKKDGENEPNWTKCRVVAEDAKAKIQLGAGHMHRLILTDKNGGDHEIIEYFILSSDVLYRVTVTFNKESFQKYFMKEGQLILNSIDRAKLAKKK